MVSTRVRYLLILCRCLIVVFMVVNLYRKRKLLFNFVFACVLFCCFLAGSSLINLSVLSDENQRKLDYVIEAVGDSYLKVSNGEIQVKIEDDWVNLNDIQILGEFTEDITILYEGREIYLGRSGVYNTLKVLKDIGLLLEKGVDE